MLGAFPEELQQVVLVCRQVCILESGKIAVDALHFPLYHDAAVLEALQKVARRFDVVLGGLSGRYALQCSYTACVDVGGF